MSHSPPSREGRSVRETTRKAVKSMKDHLKIPQLFGRRSSRTTGSTSSGSWDLSKTAGDGTAQMQDDADQHFDATGAESRSRDLVSSGEAIEPEHDQETSQHDGKTVQTASMSSTAALGRRDTQDYRDTTVDMASALSQPIAKAAYEHSTMHSISPKIPVAAENARSALEDMHDTSETFQPLLKSVSLFVTMVEALGEIHPYAKAASAILTSIAKPVLAQIKRDEAMSDLLGTISDVYDFVNDSGRLQDLSSTRLKLLERLASMTMECAYFIQDHAATKNFWLRSAKNSLLGSDTDAEISKFKDDFESIRRGFTEFGVVDIELRIDDIGTSMELQKLARVESAGLHRDKACLPGTRVRVLDDLSRWVNDPQGSRVRFILGVAGAGKSAIAHAMGWRFREIRRLASFFSFDRSFQQLRHPESILSTIAWDLAHWNSDYGKALEKVIRDDSSLAQTRSVTDQWEYLILRPARHIKVPGPILIVIDAFDESSVGVSQSRRLLLNIFSKKADALPHNFRILITSRPERDIELSLKPSSTHSAPIIDSVDLRVIDHEFKHGVLLDIKSYVLYTLQSDPDDDPLAEELITALAERSEGNFQWAFTACNFILQRVGLPLHERVSKFLAADIPGGPSSLDHLYVEILERTFPSTDADVVARFKSVMAQILCASQPLSVCSLDDIRKFATGRSGRDVWFVVQNLGALVSGTNVTSSPIRPLHTSFRDFLLSSSRSGKWCISLQDGHTIMSLGCVHLMNSCLRFNICGLETSYRRNRDVTDLDYRVSQHTSEALRYAVSFWKDHVYGSNTDLDFYNEFYLAVREFLTEKLPYWLELLSILGHVNQATKSLRVSATFFKDSSDANFRAVIQDSLSFVQRFSSIIAQSAPHIYTSALPFTPLESKMRSIFFRKFPYTPKVYRVAERWPRATTVIAVKSFVYSVAYSPDGRHIVSGCEDSTVRLWDAATGEAVGEPFLGHSAIVQSVAYSPDGRRIVSGSTDSTVRVWNAETGEAVGNPLRGHTGDVMSVAFSPDCRHIVSGSQDSTIRVWEAETGEAVGEPLRGHVADIGSVAYSPDNRHIASGSHDSTVRVWDAQSGEAIREPFRGHAAAVMSVAYSPDGCHIVSGSIDSTVRVWNAVTGEAIGELFHNHSAIVMSVAYSPDGHRIVTSSVDSTVRIWDAKTGQAVGEALYGHSAIVWSAAYSPDGRHIVSGSGDLTVRVWDAESAELTGEAIYNHSAAVLSVACSSDGRYVVSACQDTTVRVWDAETGETVREPFRGHSAIVWSVACSPDGRRIASGSHDSTVRLWDAKTGDAVGTFFHGSSAAVRSVAYAPDGHYVASGSEDSTVSIWDVETGLAVGRPLQGHWAAVLSVAYSPDGSRIVSGASDSEARIWDAETGEAIGTPLRGHSDSLWAVAYSPDGRCIVSGSGDCTVRIWDATTGEAIGKPLYGHSAAVKSVAYSPDGRHIVSGSSDSTVRVWDAKTGEAIGEPLYGHSAAVRSVSYSPDGRHIVSGSSDSTVRASSASFEERSGSLSATGLHFLQNYESSPDKSDSTAFHGSPLLRIQDGWVMDEMDNLIIWVPYEYRSTLRWPGTRWLIGGRAPSTTIDFKDAHYGADWAAIGSA